MRAFISFLPLLACPAIMFLCMRGMARMGDDRNHSAKMETSSSSESQLRQEVHHLREELSELRARGEMGADHQVLEEAVKQPVPAPTQN
jgi:C4-dicarboxylate-specific signal transduction histidine kinase